MDIRSNVTCFDLKVHKMWKKESQNKINQQFVPFCNHYFVIMVGLYIMNYVYKDKS